MYCEFEEVEEEVVVAYFMVLSWHLPRNTEGKHGNVSSGRKYHN